MKARKEITIAVIIGLIVGLIVVGGIIRARSALNKLTPPEIPLLGNKKSPSNNNSQPTGLFLNLTTLDNQVVSSPNLTIAGTTLPNTYIVILGEKAEYIIIPSETGAFTQEVTLVSGANSIKVTVYQDDGQKQEASLTAVYTTAEI